ncbi:MAG: hypothetical protein KAU20_04715, partial [Nanoarchaeota archaeon]|nr:hypothetical protein [Nanoarchaeota archaeon]
MESTDRTKILNEKLENLKKWHLERDRTKTIKVGIRTWDNLKSLKQENETFNDVIKELLMERTRAIGDENIKAIRYQRKINFFDFPINNKDVGFEVEYNDVKGQKSDFVLDLKIKKVFFGKKSISTSEFFGIDNVHKHYSNFFLALYMGLVKLALGVEFKLNLNLKDVQNLQNFFNLVLWRKLYYDYSLSEESFKEDIEEPLRLNEEEKPSEEWRERIENSIIEKLMKEKR